jgi:acylphosphatase
MFKSLSIHISGKVQGVFFRASTKEKADELGVTGMVRNEKNGSVYIEAQGEQEQLEEFVKWCRRGPQHARVDAVDVSEISFKDYKQFTIER